MITCDLGRGRRSRRDNNKLISFYLGRTPTESAEESTRRERDDLRRYYNNNIVLASRPKDSRARLNYLYGYAAAFRDLLVAATGACVKCGRPLTSKTYNIMLQK